ncbi:ABC transporter ATP-binding protein [Lachnoclostridium sp. Marseille-P6806]|uniref:ABC transporter ATP-binding protein n=1 Tax=Lachnoclostridium sp. Marseille-P6806 TaxID=2364793 RepID=UPI00102F8B9E|nr:ABC transporter ATP-binding protein [Lachnoclostridium sp. Marseille-P6806]
MLNVVRRVLRLSGDLSKKIYVGFICSFLDSVVTMFPMGAVFYVLSTLQAGALSGQDWKTILCILGGSLLARMVFKYGIHSLQSAAGFEFVARERLTLGDKLRNAAMGFFHDRNMGDITASVTTDLNFLENYSMHVLDRITTGMVSMVIISAFILWFDWRIGLIFILGALCSFLVYGRMQVKGKELTANQRRVQAEAVEATLEYVQGIFVIKSFNMEEKNLSGIETTYDKTADASYALERAFAPMNVAYSMVFRVTACAIMLAAQFLSLRGEIDFPTLAVILIASFSIFAPVEVMGQLTPMIRSMEASLDRVEQIKKENDIDDGGRDIDPASFDIDFQDVSFSYDQGVKALEHVSFSIPEGSMTAIVGPSGSGKTTITRLIARFWDVQEGCILIGGHDVREFTSDSLLKNMSMVFQNVYLFRDTIENNIKFGCPDATHEQVVEAAQKARCHDFISALPKGYQTMVGEGGSTLSGGEKQRISIARAILKDAPIVLLDEATASVDPENEMHLQQAISDLVKNKTLIVIAHRLSTIREADQILVIDNGQLVQSGKHQELIEKQGIYQKFWEIRQNAKNWRVAG